MSLNLSWIEFIYWSSTIVGGVFFVLRTVMMVAGFAGGDADLDGDMGADTHLDGDLDGNPDGGSHHDADASFKMLTVQGLTAFFLMFGLVGLATLYAAWPVVLTMLAGTAAGAFTMWVIAQVFRGMGRLQMEGNIHIENAVGQEGRVYLTIQPKAGGQVQVAVQGALKIFDAVAVDGRRIATGEKVRVVGVSDANTLKVERMEG
jgi:membrane protein implicated in regulation of membrane protease activity